MITSVNRFLSASGKSMRRSAIREILKALQQPGMISFAGGLPAPETFPVEDLKEIVGEILEKNGAESLQYGITEGDPHLRQVLVERYNKQGISLKTENLIITTGSQQAIDLAARIFIDPGDYVLCGLPSYLGAINTFITYGAKMKGICLDEAGMKSSELEETIIRLKDLGHKVKLVYLIPDFQNPTGITMAEERRQQIIDIADRHDLLVIEDSPYREIRFGGEPRKMMYELDTTGRVITLCTFSKIFAPGFRVGWVMGHPLIIDRIVMAKQTSDLCTAPFNQMVIARYIEKGLLEINLEKTISLYRQRRDHMLSCLRKYMPEGVTWSEPQGGLFLFITLPGGMDSDSIFTKAAERKVAFVSGSTFYCNGSGRNTLRINFSYSKDDETEEGIRRLASVVAEEMSHT
ncbi:MAG: PLP-dependent aminotransferase family protein [Bacteroidales bacterium]